MKALVAPLERWTDKEQTQAEVQTLILDQLFEALPSPPYTDDDKQTIADRIYQHIWQQTINNVVAA